MPALKPGAPPALKSRETVTFAAIPDGMVGKVLGELALGNSERLVFVARDGQRLAEVERGIRFFSPGVEVLDFPAWDCVPYDRASPNSGVVATRMATLAALHGTARKPQIVMTTVNAILQRVPARSFVFDGSLTVIAGTLKPMDDTVRWLERNGFLRSATVREPGEYAVRGGILDLFPAGADEPVRLDFFGDTLETIRGFDPETQRSTTPRKRVDLVPANEMLLTPDSIARFRERYVTLFGAATRDDLLYQSVSEGRRYVGMEHWLPLFADALETLFDHVGEAPVVLDHLVDEAIAERLEQIADHYAARADALEGKGIASSVPYKPLPPDSLYLTRNEWPERLSGLPVARISPFAQPEAPGVIDMGGRQGRTFAAERSAGDVNVFDAVIRHIEAVEKAGKRVVVAGWSEGSRDRTAQVLVDHGMVRLKPVATWPEAVALGPHTVAMAVLGLEAGFETAELAVIGEQDILGDRLVRAPSKRRASDFISDATSLAEGDLVVHIDHGIGRFTGLRSIEAAGAPHDCLEI
ncbi:MAG: transcription-repair coupling factor, partial [Rhizobiales bacterium]|nr:transcription-repair coupling factor [Hyphomicrobiales bacterium]